MDDLFCLFMSGAPAHDFSGKKCCSFLKKRTKKLLSV